MYFYSYSHSKLINSLFHDVHISNVFWNGQKNVTIVMDNSKTKRTVGDFYSDKQSGPSSAKHLG